MVMLSRSVALSVSLTRKVFSGFFFTQFNHARNCSPYLDASLGPQFAVAGCPAPNLTNGLLPLAPLGVATRVAHRYFVENPDRGVPYAPIAVMIPQFHGMGLGFWDIGFANGSLTNFSNGPPNDAQAGPWAAGILPYTEGDCEMMYLFMLLFGKSMPTPGGGQQPAGFTSQTSSDESERLVNLRHPDMFDVLVPDRTAPYPNGLDDVLDAYRVVVLTGDVLLEAPGSSVGDPRALPRAMWRWIRRGGVVLIHGRAVIANKLSANETGLELGARHNISCVRSTLSNGTALRDNARTVETYEARLSPATRVLAELHDDAGQRHPAVTSFEPPGAESNGGKIVTVLPPRSSDLEAFGLLDWAIAQLVEDVTPFRVVRGSAELIVARNAAGWRITVINNLGVTKECTYAADWPHGGCTPDQVDASQRQTVEIAWDARYGALRSARELVTGTKLQVGGGPTVAVSVPAGDVRVVSLALG